MTMTEELKAVEKLIGEYRIAATNEHQLHRIIEQILIGNSFLFSSEVRLSVRDRIDILTDGGIGIEIKTKGSAASVAAQLLRYAECDQVQALILVTSKRLHLTTGFFREKEILGKPLVGIWVGGNL